MASPERDRRARDLFDRAADLPPAEQGPFLDRECADDPALRADVASLLGFAEPGDLLDTSPVSRAAAAARSAAAESPPVQPPASIGPYRIIRLVGEGGMGAVYEAEQASPRRTVAVKVVHPALATGSVLHRFQREAHLLGQLRHPGIAQIYEAGAIDSAFGRQPYFAMEFVRGEPLTRYADAAGLDVRARLELIVLVCDALHYAHEQGVIHRDLKPANILVEPPPAAAGRTVDGPRTGVGAQPKILDFGIARATAPDLRARTIHTATGQLLGTLPYMSPEQAGGDAGMVDRRSDVYALGVILYELLTGRLPTDVRERNLPDALRAIREQEPVRVDALRPGVHPDVATIVAAALRKEREQRYQSAAALADDIRRFLADEPIAARPATTIYRIRRFARRNKALLALAVVAAASALLITGIALRSEESRRLARESDAAARLLAYKAALRDAVAAYRASNTGAFQAALAAAPADLRGWEWRALSHLADRSHHAIRIPDASRMLTLRPDGAHVVLGFPDGRVDIVSSADGRVVRSLDAGGDKVLLAAYSPDARLLALRTVAGRLTVTDPESGSTLWSLERQSPLATLEFSPDGATILAGDENGFAVTLLDARTGRVRTTIPIVSPSGTFASYVPGTDRVCVQISARAVEIRDAGTGEVVSTAEVHGATVSIDGRYLLSPYIAGVRVMTTDGAVHGDVPPVGSPPEALVTIPGHSLFATIERAGLISVYDPEHLEVVASFHASDAPILMMQCTAGGETLAAGGGGHVRFFAAPGAPLPLAPPASNDTLGGAAIARDAPRVLTLGWGGARVFDAHTGAELWTNIVARPIHDQRFLGDIAPDGSRVAVAGWDRSLVLLDGASGRVVATHAGLTAEATAVVWTDERTLALALADGTLAVVEAGSPDTVRVLRPPAPGRAWHDLYAAAEPGAFFAAEASGRLERWTRGDAAPALTIQLDGPPRGVAGTPDGERIVVSRSDGSLALFDARTGLPRTSVALGAGGRVAVHPDGSRIVVAPPDGGVRVLRSSDLAELIALPIPLAKSYGAVFTSDDALIAGTGSGCFVRFDTSVAPGVDLRRRDVLLAQTLVNRLFTTLKFSEDIIDRVQHDEALTPGVRETAVAIARARGDQINRFNSDAWGICIEPNYPPERVADALRCARIITAARPDDHAFLNTRAGVEYRAGLYEDALATLRRCEELALREQGRPDVGDLVFLVMTLHRLGRADEARRAWETLQVEFASSPLRTDAQILQLVREAGMLLGAVEPGAGVPATPP